MSKENTDKIEKYGEWIYRGLAIYFLWNIYVEVQKVPGHEIRLNKHEHDIHRLDNAVFSPAWDKPPPKKRDEAIRNHSKATKFLMDATEDNIASANKLNRQVDSLTNNN